MPDKQKADWTVMVYLAGDNNLNEEMMWSLQEMDFAVLDFGKVSRVNVVAQFDAAHRDVPTRRFNFTSPPHDEGNIILRAVEEAARIPDTNTGSPYSLGQFICWGAKEHPAHHYMVVLSGHGSGTTEDFLLRDQNPADSLTIPELRAALGMACEEMREQGLLEQDRKIDILGMDCCLMSMAEVCHAITDYTDIAIGAEGFEPSTGWPYYQILTELFGNTSQTSRQLAELVVSQFISYYADYSWAANMSVDLTSIDLQPNLVDALNKNVAQLAEKLIGTLEIEGTEFNEARDQILAAHWEAQSYKYDQYVDLKDLCNCLRQRPSKLLSKVKRECLDVIEAVENMVILTGCSGPAFQHSNGLSVYFPWAEVSPEYQSIEFAKGKWNDFLELYVEKTRKPARYTRNDEAIEAHVQQLRKPQYGLGGGVAAGGAAAGEADDSSYKYALSRYALSRYALSRYALSRYALSRYESNRYALSRYALSRYALSRYALSRYALSRYALSRYALSREQSSPDRWVMNPPRKTGATLWSKSKGDFPPLHMSSAGREVRGVASKPKKKTSEAAKTAKAARKKKGSK